MDVAARCVGRCYVSPVFGESESFRLLNDRLFLKPDLAGSSRVSKLSHRRLSFFFRPIMATDESISSRFSDCAGCKCKGIHFMEKESSLSMELEILDSFLKDGAKLITNEFT